MIIEFKDLKQVREKHRNQKIVLSGGVFDLLHLGHIEYLKTLKSYGDILVMALTNDKRVKERKGESRPIHNEKTRSVIMDAIRYVDYVVIIPSDLDTDISSQGATGMFVLESLLPDLFVSIDSDWLNYENKVRDLGVELKIQPIEKIDSTTDVIKRIKS